MKEDELTLSRSKVMTKDEFEAQKTLRYNRIMKKLDTVTVSCSVFVSVCANFFSHALCLLLSLMEGSHGKGRSQLSCNTRCFWPCH